MITYDKVEYSEKKKNILMVLNEIVLNPNVSTNEIAEATHLSFATISRDLNMLRKSGIVRVSGKESTDMGRPHDLFGLDPEFGYFLHFNIFTGHVDGILADLCGRPIASSRKAMDRNIQVEDFVRLLRVCAEELTVHTGKKYDKIMAAGIAVPGLVDEKNLIIHRIPDFYNFKNKNLFHYAKSALEMPIVINNEARLCAMGEFIGKYKNMNTIVYLDVTKYGGIGAGIILNGKLFAGENGRAGEIGDMLVDIRNYNDNFYEDAGCLESVAGLATMFDKLEVLMRRGRAEKLKKLMLQEQTDTLTLELIEAAVRAHDFDVTDIFDETMKMWAAAIINLSAVLDPDVIVMGGVVSSQNTIVLARICHYISKMLPYNVNITASNLDDQVQIAGGLYMLKRYVLNEIVSDLIFLSENE